MWTLQALAAGNRERCLMRSRQPFRASKGGIGNPGLQLEDLRLLRSGSSPPARMPLFGKDLDVEKQNSKKCIMSVDIVVFIAMISAR